MEIRYMNVKGRRESVFERQEGAQNIHELMTNNDSISSLTFYFPPPFFDKRASEQASKPWHMSAKHDDIFA